MFVLPKKTWNILIRYEIQTNFTKPSFEKQFLNYEK